MVKITVILKVTIGLLLIQSSITLSQNLPVVVDNSAWFPKVETQWHMNCTNFSLIYYLKSYLWNRHFQRDPNLPQSQFSPDFIWNQIISNPIDGKTKGHFAQSDGAGMLMSIQGCATVTNFPLQTDEENLPDFLTRESSLYFRTKDLTNIILYDQDSIKRMSVLNALKDSLAKGTCFTMQIPTYNYFYKETSQRPYIFNCYPGIARDSVIKGHQIAIVGYDDSLITASGKGAFKAINSGGVNFGDKGFFYLDYNWLFYAKWYTWGFFFLEENYSYKPELSLNVNVSGMVSGDEIDARKNMFVDTVYSISNSNFRFDYQMNDYFYYSHFLTIKKINNQVVPAIISLNNLESCYRNNIVFIPRHNHNGNRQLLVDLTDYVKANDFKSLELLVVDPISATYTGESGDVIYSYTREAKSKINEAYIKFLGTSKALVGKVIDLPDTTIVAENFYSYPASFNLPYPQNLDVIFIKRCVSVLKRRLITFRIEDQSTTDQYSIALSSYPVNGGTTSGAGTFEVGSSITVSATPFAGYTFINWTENGIEVSKNKDYAFVACSNRTLQANFQINTYILIFDNTPLTTESGTVTKSPDQENYNYGTVVTLTAIPKTGRKFANWCGDVTGSTNPIEVIMDRDKRFGANFEYCTYTLVVNSSGSGNVTRDINQNIYWHGTTVTLTAIPNPDYKFSTWSGDVASSENPLVLVIDGNKNITAHFIPITSIDDIKFVVPDEYTLMQNYPNPFNPTTKIKFGLPETAFIKLSIYDLLGREVNTLLNSELHAGYHEIELDANKFLSGIYFYRIQARNFTQTKKMILLK